jgi:hypothetical protein
MSMPPGKPPPRKTPPFGLPIVQSDEDRHLQEMQRRRSRQEHPTPPPAPVPDNFEDDPGTNPIMLIDHERWQDDEKYRRDWEATLREFNENAAYRILWERSGRSRRSSDQAATASANAALAVNADAAKVGQFTEELRRIDFELKEISTVLKITKWILGFVIAAVLGSVTVVVTKIFNWGLSTGEAEVRIDTLEKEVNSLMRQEKHP